MTTENKALIAAGAAVLIIVSALVWITWSWWSVGNGLDKDQDERGERF